MVRSRRPVASRLGLKLGDRLRIGDRFASLASSRRARRGVRRALFGPQVIIAAASEDAAIRPRLVNCALSAAFARSDPRLDPRAATSGGGWQLRECRCVARVAAPLDRIRFPGSRRITALLVGGVGISNAVAGCREQGHAIATLKCLGANAPVFAAYFIQIMALALVGIAAGMLSVGCSQRGRAFRGSQCRCVSASRGAGDCGISGCVTLVSRCGRSPQWAVRRAPCSGPGAGRAILRRAGGKRQRRFRPRGARCLDRGGPQNRLWYVATLAAFCLFRLAERWSSRGAPPARPTRPCCVWRSAPAPAGGADRADRAVARHRAQRDDRGRWSGAIAVEIEGRLTSTRRPISYRHPARPAAGFEEIVRATRPASTRSVRAAASPAQRHSVEGGQVAPEAQWAAQRPRADLFGRSRPARPCRRQWWPADYRGAPLVSFDASWRAAWRSKR